VGFLGGGGCGVVSGGCGFVGGVFWGWGELVLLGFGGLGVVLVLCWGGVGEGWCFVVVGWFFMGGGFVCFFVIFSLGSGRVCVFWGWLFCIEWVVWLVGWGRVLICFWEKGGGGGESLGCVFVRVVGVFWVWVMGGEGGFVVGVFDVGEGCGCVVGCVIGFGVWVVWCVLIFLGVGGCGWVLWGGVFFDLKGGGLGRCCFCGGVSLCCAGVWGYC